MDLQTKWKEEGAFDWKRELVRVIKRKQETKRERFLAGKQLIANSSLFSHLDMYFHCICIITLFLSEMGISIGKNKQTIVVLFEFSSIFSG